MFMKACFTLEHEVRSEGASLEVEDVEPCRCCQAWTVGTTTYGSGAGAGGLELQAHRLRPEGLSLRTTFGGIVGSLHGLILTAHCRHPTAG